MIFKKFEIFFKHLYVLLEESNILYYIMIFKLKTNIKNKNTLQYLLRTVSQ